MAGKRFAAAVGPSVGFRKAAPGFGKNAFKMPPKPERLVTVCHYCNQTFAAEEAHYEFSVTNYVNLVAEAMGIRPEDKFKKYTLWGSLERILKDSDGHMAESPFESECIIEVLRAVFMG